MSGNKKIILILVVVAVAYYVLLAVGTQTGRADEGDPPESEEGVSQWLEETAPEWLTSMDGWLPKPRFEDSRFPITLDAGSRRNFEIPPDSEHAFREAIFVHLAGPSVSLRYVPADPDEVPGGAGEDALEFELRAGPENDSRKSIVLGESGGVLRLSNEGDTSARIGLAD